MSAPSRALDLAALRRRPDVEDPTLLAHDVTDELLTREGLRIAAERGLRGADIVVLGERYGAIALSLAAAGYTGVRIIQDRLALERSVDSNAAEAGISPASYAHAAAEPGSLDGARLLLWQLPRSLAEIDAGAWLASHAADDAVLVAGGRLKHLDRTMNAPLERRFGPVRPQLAERKSRLLVSTRDATLAPGTAPRAQEATHTVAGTRLRLAAGAATFGGPRPDPGTRLMLQAVAERPELLPGAQDTIVDLGCGNGTVSAWVALTRPEARVEATDDSSDAVTSTLLTAALNGVEDRVSAWRSDAGDHLADGSVDLVLLNPPFHQGATVHSGIATKLIRSAARMLRPGGRMVCVWNSHLRYRPRLERIVGPTRQLARDKTFTLTLSTRRP